MKLKNQDAEEESNVRLHCELSKAGVPVQWKKGKELLKSGLKYQIIHQDTTMELIIKKAMPEDSGVYSCICGDQSTKANINVFGKMRSSQAFIIILVNVLPLLILFWLFSCSGHIQTKSNEPGGARRRDHSPAL